MIIQCESCQAKFKLDDSKVTEKGVKVKCARCENIFTVRKEPAADMPPSPLEEKTFDISEEPSADEGGEAQKKADEDYTFDASEGSMGLEGEGEEETASFDIGEEEETETFDMGEEEETASFDMGGEEETETFDMGEEEETETFDMGGEKETKTPEEPQGSTGGPAINFGEFALEGEDEPEQEEAPREEMTLELDEKETEVEAEGDGEELSEEPAEEEVPDLGEVREKTDSSRSKVLVLVLLLLALIGGGAYFFPDLQPVINMVKEKLNAEKEGAISIKSLNGYYLQTDKEGPLFIIEAEAQNDYKGARSFIQVKGKLYDDKGKVVMEQAAYAGNAFSSNKLLEVSRTEVRKEMAYKVGKGLSNSNIMPGSKVAFMLVFYDVPGSLAEFDVEVVSSEDVTK